MNVDTDVLVRTLGDALSQEVAVFKAAEQLLNEWQTKPTFYVYIVKIMVNQSIDTNIRWISAVLLNQGVERYWLTSENYCLSAEDKEEIRNELFAVLTEPAHNVALKMATIISAIANYDYSNHWLNLIVQIMNKMDVNVDYCNSKMLTCEMNSTLHRGMLVLKYVIKQLASKRYPNGRLHFSNITSDIYQNIFLIWKKTTERFIEDPRMCHLDVALNSLKILEHLVLSGFTFEKLMKYEFHNVIVIMLEYFDKILKIRYTGVQDPVLKLTMEKYTNRVMKLCLNLEKKHDRYLSYVLTEHCMRLLLYYLFSAEGKVLTYNKLRNLFLFLFKSLVVVTGKYKTGLQPLPKTCQDFFNNFIKTDGNFSKVIQCFINDHLKLTEDDLQLWRNSPEDFVLQEVNYTKSNDHYETRNNVLDLIRWVMLHYPKESNEEFKRLFRSVMIPSANCSLDAILFKEAVYRIFEMSKEFYIHIDLDEWLNNVFCIEMSNNENPYLCILQRRLLCLLTIWNNKSLSKRQPMLYDIYLHGLDESKDFVIRFTTALCLNEFIRFEFDREGTTSWWQIILFKLYSLLKVTNDCELKIQILQIMVNTVEIHKYNFPIIIENIEKLIPMLWEESKNHNLTRCHLVHILGKLSEILKSKSYILYKYMLPIIELGINPNNPDSVYLLENCLYLWLQILNNVKNEHVEQLVRFCPYLPLILNLDHSTETLEYCFKICTEYILIMPDKYLQNYGPEFMHACSKILHEINDENRSLFSNIFNAAFILSPDLASHCVKIIIPLYLRLIITKKMNVSELKSSFLIIGRVLMYSVQLFNECLLSYLMIEESTSLDSVLDIIVSEWIRTLRGYCSTEENKIFAMASCCLLSIRSNSMSNHFSEMLKAIFDAVKHILYQNSGEEEDPLALRQSTNSMDHLGSLFEGITSLSDSSDELYGCYGEENDDYEVQHENRIIHLRLRDPIYNVDVRRYVRAKLLEVRHLYLQNELDVFLAPLWSEYHSQIQSYFYGVQ